MSPISCHVLLVIITTSLVSTSSHAWSFKKINGTTSSPPASTNRRLILEHLTIAASSVLVASPATAHAGEIGARITKAVTESDLGITVRRSVVRGAQLFDGIDAKIEQFSDKYGLGAERSQRPDKPQPKVIPPLKPLDKNVASKLLQSADGCFLDVTKIAKADLDKQIVKVADMVLPSFERAGQLILSGDRQHLTTRPENAQQLNFATYTHFKAFADLLVERKIDFRVFRPKFEAELGREVVALLLPDYDAASFTSGKLITVEEQQALLTRAVTDINLLCTRLVEGGLVAAIDPSPLDPELVSDWLEDLTPLSWSIAFGGDSTMGSQILLQEQGFRLYPNFARFAILYILKSFPGQDVSLEDYYMDTDYNSDPDKYEVKEVLLNIVLESK